LAVAPAGRSAASYTITRDTTRQPERWRARQEQLYLSRLSSPYQLDWPPRAAL